MHDDLALVADGKELANRVRVTEWSEPEAQLVICDHCGISGCSVGDQVAVRRLGEFVAFLALPRGLRDRWRGDPAGGRPLSGSDRDSLCGSDSTEFAPPSWMHSRGGLLVRSAEWEALRAQHHVLPAWDRLRSASWTEVALQAQLEAPARVLGDPGWPLTGLGARVIATDPWLSVDELATVERLFGGHSETPAEVLEATTRPVTIILQEPLVTADLVCRAMDGRLGLWLAPGIAVAPG